MPGRLHSRRRGVQQFVIFAIVQRLVERRALEQRHVVEFGSDAGRLAQTMQIERQAVADVHAGGRHADQLAAEFQPGHDRRACCASRPAARKRRDIARPRARAQQCLAFGDGSANHYVAHQLTGVRNVAACK